MLFKDSLVAIFCSAERNLERLSCLISIKPGHYVMFTDHFVKLTARYQFM